VSLLLVGDSILDGMSLSLPAAFAAVYPRAEVHVEAETGAGTRRWYTGERFRRLVAEHRPGVVVVELGTNDEGSERSSADYAEIVGLMARDARLYGGRLLWIGPFNTDDGARERWNIIRRTVGSADSIDGLALAQGLPRAPDGLHIQMGSYPELARRLARAVAERTGVLSTSDGGTMGAVTARAVGAAVALLIAWWAGR
jgi:lysophospholipase L1-like esterase